LRGIVKLDRTEAARSASRLLKLQPDRVIFAHGRWFERDGTAALRRSLRWLLD
jgi:glyoxylase-like metal-dependent hydrolase (beta-lactamase superfamily II)